MTNRPSKSKPFTVYFDQNILNDIATKGAMWSDTKWGKRLLELSVNGEIEVWASPANCLETALNSDLEQRHQMALALNTLTRGQRIMPDYQTMIVRNFLEQLKEVWPDDVSFERLDKLQRRSQQNYIALLGQMAALKDYDCSAGFAGVLIPKIINQLIHTEIFADPKKALNERLEQIRTGNYNGEDPYRKYDKLDIEELKARQEMLKSQKHHVDKSAVELVRKNKQKLISGYAREELHSAIYSVFEYFDDAAFSINFTHIVQDWNPQNKADVSSLNPELFQQFNAGPSRKAICLVLNTLRDRFVNLLGLPQLYYRTIINELEKALNEGEIPTGGLVLDAQHTIAAICVDCFVCKDSRLVNNMKTIFSDREKNLGQAGYVVTDIGEFERKLKKHQA